MKVRTFLTLVFTLGMVLTFSVSSYADISNAAMLFLRIAAGARPAGMGEAFVAVADDATATHWNPAGLGNPPLSDSWINVRVPDQYRPLTGVATVKAGGGSTYQAYDLWAISPKGLVRYDNRNWNVDEVFATKTDQTAERIVSSYCDIADPQQLERVMDRVARANNADSYENLVAFRDSLLTHLPDGYDRKDEIQLSADSVLIYYRLCRLNWTPLKEAIKNYSDAIASGSMGKTQADRIWSRLDQSRMRYLPEDLHIPYSALVEGVPTSIASDGQRLAVGTSNGLLTYNGQRWTIYTETKGLPSNKVTSLQLAGSVIVVGTDKGLAIYDGVRTEPVVDSTNSLTGEIEAVGGAASPNLLAVSGGDLYRYDGRKWVNTMNYTVAIGDTPEKIAGRFMVYGTPQEMAAYLAKLETSLRSADSAGAALTPGAVIQVPFLAQIKGQATSIQTTPTMSRIWIGTDQGVLFYTGEGWTLPGYKPYTVGLGQTVDSLVALRKLEPEEASAYAEALRTVNDLDNNVIDSGRVVKVYANRAAAPVTRLQFDGGRLYVATTRGLLEFENGQWSQSERGDMGTSSSLGAETHQSETWLASQNQLSIKSRGRSEFTFMHVKWLPELADDIYYGFFSFTKCKEGLGTFGGSVTYISYGTFIRTTESGPEAVDEFKPFEMAFSLSYGTALTNKLKGGVSAKVIYSRLSPQGAAAEQGHGTATAFALDFGLLYNWNKRLTFGLATTNLGPKVAYIDAAQSDPLPMNLAFGFSYKLKESDLTRLLIAFEGNKDIASGFNNALSQEVKEVVWNGGAEFTYANLISARAGYIYDQEGDIKTATVGIGLQPISWAKADFSYIPNNGNVTLANTLRFSLTVLP